MELVNGMQTWLPAAVQAGYAVVVLAAILVVCALLWGGMNVFTARSR